MAVRVESTYFGMPNAPRVWKAWPDVPIDRPDLHQWNFQITRLRGIAEFGGSNCQEIWETVRRIKLGDKESWHREWLRMAEIVEAMGADAEKRGNTVCAKYDYHRATNYYRMAWFYLDFDDPMSLQMLKKNRECFVKASKYVYPSIEPVEVPYEGKKLHGYFAPAFGVEGPAPTLHFINGGDSLSECAYFTLGKVAQQMGMNFFVFNEPGVGLTMWELGIPRRYDSEAFITPAFDWLVKRPEVDPNKIVSHGGSFAGYLICRATVYEKRISAAIAAAPGRIGKRDSSRYSGPMTKTIEKAMSQYGAKTQEELIDIASRFTLVREDVRNIKIPYLIIQGRHDGLQGTLDFYHEVGGPKRLRIIEPVEGVGGAIHCQKDNLHQKNRAIFPWLIDIGILKK